MDGASVQNRKRPPFLWWTQSITRVCGQGTDCRLAFGPLRVIQLGLTLQGSPGGGEAAKMLTEKRESECRRTGTGQNDTLFTGSQSEDLFQYRGREEWLSPPLLKACEAVWSLK